MCGAPRVPVDYLAPVNYPTLLAQGLRPLALLWVGLVGGFHLCSIAEYETNPRLRRELQEVPVPAEAAEDSQSDADQRDVYPDGK